MAKAKTPSQKLAQALEAEYKTHDEEWKALRAARLEQFNALHETQRKAILDALNAWHALRQSYYELCSPTFDEICKAEEALMNLCFHFNAEGK